MEIVRKKGGEKRWQKHQRLCIIAMGIISIMFAHPEGRKTQPTFARIAKVGYGNAGASARQWD
jgi:hypothetical protein